MGFLLISVCVADLLSRRALEALDGRLEHVDAFLVFAQALPDASVQKWTTMVLAWEANMTKPNPYQPSTNGAIFYSVASISSTRLTSVPQFLLLQTFDCSLRRRTRSTQHLSLGPRPGLIPISLRVCSFTRASSWRMRGASPF